MLTPPEVLLDRYTLHDIRSHAFRLHLANVEWFDITPLVDERETHAISGDMVRLAIDHVLARGLMARHPVRPHLLRIVQQHHPCPLEAR